MHNVLDVMGLQIDDHFFYNEDRGYGIILVNGQMFDTGGSDDLKLVPLELELIDSWVAFTLQGLKTYMFCTDVHMKKGDLKVVEKDVDRKEYALLNSDRASVILLKKNEKSPLDYQFIEDIFPKYEDALIKSGKPLLRVLTLDGPVDKDDIMSSFKVM